MTFKPGDIVELSEEGNKMYGASMGGWKFEVLSEELQNQGNGYSDPRRNVYYKVRSHDKDWFLMLAFIRLDIVSLLQKI